MKNSIALVRIAVVLVAAAWWAAEASAQVRLFKNPLAAADFSVTAIDGQTIRLSALRGKVVLVNFWATWCPPCRAEIPDLIKLQTKYKDRLVIIGVSEDENGLALVKRFVAEHRINYPIVMSTPALAKVFPGVSSLPTTFVLDGEGRIVQRHLGLLDAKRTELEVTAIAGLNTSVSIVRVEPDKPVGLPSTAHVMSVPGIELAKLTPEKRAETLRRLNTEGCTCGCNLTVAKCRIEDPSCSVSLPIARRIAAEVAGKPKS